MKRPVGVVYGITWILWLVFLIFPWGRLLAPLLLFPFLIPNTRMSRMGLALPVWVAHVIVLSGFFRHPQVSVSPLALWMMGVITGLVALSNTILHVWPPLVLPLPRVHRAIRLAVWNILALATEWLAVRHRLVVPAWFLTDALAYPPASWIGRFWGEWAGAGLWLVGVSTLVYSRELPWPWNRLWMACVLLPWGWAFLRLSMPSVEEVAHHRLLLISPGIRTEASPDLYMARYLDLLKRWEENVSTSFPEGDTLWLVFPEGTFGKEVQSFRNSEVQVFWEKVKEMLSVPMGRAWHTTVWWGDRKRSRFILETPEGRLWTYDKRWLFPGGEKPLPIVTSFFGSPREAGPSEQSGRFPVGSWYVHVLICNEAFTPELLHITPGERGMILNPAQLGWLYHPWTLEAYLVRERVIVQVTGLPLCSTQRQGGVYCLIPTAMGVHRVGEISGTQPNLLEVPLLISQPNNLFPYRTFLFMGWMGSMLILILGIWFSQTGRGIRSRISSRI